MGTITNLDTSDPSLVDRLATITFEAFKETAPDWVPDLELARRQVLNIDTPGRIGRVAFEGSQAAGWIGLIRGARVWEVHPIAVATDHQQQGVGQALVEDAVTIAKNAGALTLLASTSDEVGSTNLFDADLYQNPAAAIRDLTATGRSPYRFWESVGFSVVGLVPDAEGIGKPSIQLARRL